MSDLDHGPQPLGALMGKWGLQNHDLVEASPEQLTHKQVQRACQGRRLTLKMMMKVNRAYNIAIWNRLDKEQKEQFVEYGHKDCCNRISQVILRCSKPKPKKYPPKLQHVGDHLRAKRMDRDWDQPRLARFFGFFEVTVGTLLQWEFGRKTPLVRHWPRIIEFLGYDPGPKAEDLAGTLRQWRHRAGFTQGRAAEAVGVSRKVWRAWELATTDPGPEVRSRVDALLAASS